MAIKGIKKRDIMQKKKFNSNQRELSFSRKNRYTGKTSWQRTLTFKHFKAKENHYTDRERMIFLG